MKRLLVGEVANLIGIHPETVKRLEKRGLIESQRDLNGWRRYDPEAVEMLRRLYGLTSKGASLGERGQ